MEPLSVGRWILFQCITIGMFIVLVNSKTKWKTEINLPPEHIAFFFNQNKQWAEKCQQDPKCPYKMHLERRACWGYEHNCTQAEQYSVPICRGDSKGWVRTKNEQIAQFYLQSDFGYIRERKQELRVLCSPNHPDDSALECTRYLRFCRGRNILFDFKSLIGMTEPLKYRMDIIQEGQIGGHCVLNPELLAQEGEHKSPLQSWYPELEHFTSYSYRPISDDRCDVIITKPTIIMKLDATVNMYHHFCDFFNLYATFHLNNSFSTDINILLWDTMPYHSNFAVTWKAFTQNPITNLRNYIGKKVCFKDVVLPLLPRMIYGMYYNMPLIYGCEASGLFQAFNRHILHRLRIKQDMKERGKIRITILSRETTYRRILNEDELIRALQKVPEYRVKKVAFDRNVPFYDQIQIVQNTDIFIGIHGAGLTHMLFLPDWAAVFELYNCEDEHCYQDLARLRGLLYLTWDKNDKLVQQDEGHHPTMGAHAKFTNYGFDVSEFTGLVGIGANHVRNHHVWKQTCGKPKHEEL